MEKASGEVKSASVLSVRKSVGEFLLRFLVFHMKYYYVAPLL